MLLVVDAVRCGVGNVPLGVGRVGPAHPTSKIARATSAASRRSATHRGLDRADCRFIGFTRCSEVSAHAAVGHETPIALSLQRRLMLGRSPGRFVVA